MLIADGQPQGAQDDERLAAVAMLNEEADFHDIGPCALIVTEAGGRVTGLSGEALNFTRPIEGGVAVTNGVCHNEVLAIAA